MTRAWAHESNGSQSSYFLDACKYNSTTRKDVLNTENHTATPPPPGSCGGRSDLTKVKLATLWMRIATPRHFRTPIEKKAS